MGAIFADISSDASSWHARSRYTLIGGRTRHAGGVAVSRKYDLVIAVMVGNLLDERERTAAYRLLESSMVQDWISQELGGRKSHDLLDRARLARLTSARSGRLKRY